MSKHRIQQFFNNLYARFNQKQFSLIAVIICFVGDLALCRYLYLYFTSNEFISFFMQTLGKQFQELDPNLAMEMMGQTFHAELYALIIQSLVLMFVLGISLNLIHYFFYVKNQARWAFIYMKFISYLGVPGFKFIGLSALSFGPIGAYLVFQGSLYLFVAIGLSYFPVLKKSRGQ